MESIKAPSPTSLAVGTLVVIWSEAFRRQVSVWVAIKDSMEVMETRRAILSARKAHDGLPEGEPEPEAEPEPSEARTTYQRMRDRSRGVRFD